MDCFIDTKSILSDYTLLIFKYVHSYCKIESVLFNKGCMMFELVLYKVIFCSG